MDPENVERYFAAYPEGTLVSIVRNPRAWYESAAGHMPEHYSDVDGALALWSASTDATIAAAERYGERVLVLTYEQLVGDPESTMRRVAGRLGIDWAPSLLRPTFNGRPIGANSSDPTVQGEGILPERATAFSDDPRIAELAGDRYERAAAFA